MQHDRAIAESAGVGQVKRSATNTPAAMVGSSDGRCDCMCKRLRSDLVISSGQGVSLGAQLGVGDSIRAKRPMQAGGLGQCRAISSCDWCERQSSTNLRYPEFLRMKAGTGKMVICSMGIAATYF